jgi:hypothetical protein
MMVFIPPQPKPGLLFLSLFGSCFSPGPSRSSSLFDDLLFLLQLYSLADLCHWRRTMPENVIQMHSLASTELKAEYQY